MDSSGHHAQTQPCAAVDLGIRTLLPMCLLGLQGPETLGPFTRTDPDNPDHRLSLFLPHTPTPVYKSEKFFVSLP